MPDDGEPARWWHPLGDLGAWVRWREQVLIDWEERIIRAARDRATGEERAFFDTVIAERMRSRKNMSEGEVPRSE
jgi:hypothetical protein